MTPEGKETTGRRRPVRIALLVLSVVLMGVGFAASWDAGEGGGTSAPSYGMDTGSGGTAPAGLTGESGGGDEAEAEAGEEGRSAWAPVVFRLGFSFFIGFAIAAALRAFLKLTFVFAGLFALLLFGLQHAGIVEVNWTLMEGSYDSARSWLGGQFESLRAFILGYVPSAASFVAGFAVGIRR